MTKTSFDVLVWNDEFKDLEDKDDPCGMVNLSEEHADITEEEAWKIYDNCKFYHKLMMCYDATDDDGEMGEDGEVVAEDSKGDFKN